MSSEHILKEVFSHLDTQTVSFLGTTTNSQPFVRPMMLIYIDNRMFYATGIEESKIQQIKNNPLVETSILLGTGDDGGSLRIRGVIEFIEALDVKKRVSDSVPFISRFWSSYDSPKYALLELIPSYIEYMRPGTMDINRIQL